MASKNTKAADKTEETKVEEPKAERKMRTDDERIADLEAQLEKVRNKAAERDRKARNRAVEQRAALIHRRDKLNDKIAELDAVIEVEPTDEG